MTAELFDLFGFQTRSCNVVCKTTFNAQFDVYVRVFFVTRVDPLLIPGDPLERRRGGPGTSFDQNLPEALLSVGDKICV